MPSRSSVHEFISNAIATTCSSRFETVCCNMDDATPKAANQRTGNKESMSKRRAKPKSLSREDLALMTAYEARTGDHPAKAASIVLGPEQQAELDDLVAFSEGIDGIDLPPVSPSVRGLVMSAAVEAVERQDAARSTGSNWLAAVLRPGPMLSVGLLAAVLVAVSVRMNPQAVGDVSSMDTPSAKAVAMADLEASEEADLEASPAEAPRIGSPVEARPQSKTIEVIPGSLGPPNAVKAAKEPPTPLEKAIKSIENEGSAHTKNAAIKDKIQVPKRRNAKAASRGGKRRQKKTKSLPSPTRARPQPRKTDKTGIEGNAPLLAQLENVPTALIAKAKANVKESTPTRPTPRAAVRVLDPKSVQTAYRGSSRRRAMAAPAMDEAEDQPTEAKKVATTTGAKRSSKTKTRDLGKLRRSIEMLLRKGETQRSRRLLLELQTGARSQGEKAMEKWATERLKELPAKSAAKKSTK